jgi:hypothetical protein
MNRRTFNKLASLAAIGAAAESSDLIAQTSAAASEIVLEDNQLRVAFDRETGALTRMEEKQMGWIIERRPELGVSFRLLVPMPGRRDNFVFGQKQKAASVRKVAEDRVELLWENLWSEHAGKLPITITATVMLKDGKLTFDAAIDNRSAMPVETIDYPYFGDLNSPSREAPMTVRTMWYGNLGADEIYPDFGNEKGYWGVDVPTKTFGTHRSLFCLIQSTDKGLYFAMEDASQPYYMEFTFEQHPGVLHGSEVPQTESINGFPVHLEFRTCHFVFTQPGKSVKLAPVIMRPYKGTWHAGIDVYKEWRNTWFKPPQLPAWARDVHSWAMLRMNTPEEDYTISYTRFVEYGMEYAENGVKAVQLVGWNIGGQDRDDPSQDTDPHLGTRQEFKDAIAKVQAAGTNVILFGKLNWADLTTEWYREELYKYEATDPFGIRYEQGGYSYVTPTQLAGINNRRRAVMDFADPEYRAIALNEFRKVLALGSTGWFWDEICHHSNALYNFAPGHGYEPPGYIYNGDLPLSAAIRAEADKVNPDIIFAGEGQQDWLMQYYPVAETGVSQTPICQYIDRNCLMLAGVSGWDDREGLNNILCCRYVIQYEPFFYKGHLRDFPLTLEYGKKIDALRQKYKAFLWDGEYHEMLGAEVTADGAHRYSVFVADSGKRAVVVVNQDGGKAITVGVKLPNAGQLLLATPEQPEAQPTDGTIQIQKRCAAVLMEA